MNIRKISLLGLVAASLTLGSCTAQPVGQNGPARADNNEVSTGETGDDNSVVLDRPDYSDSTKYDQVAVKAVDSLQGKDHTATMHYQVTVEHPGADETVVDTFIQDEVTRTFHYSDDGTRATATGLTTSYGDWDRDNDEPLAGRYTETVVPTVVYWRDNENGLAIQESRTFDNEVKNYYAANMDDSTGEVTPIIFDSEFQNPWDFVDYSDLSHIEGEDDNTYHLNLTKAEYFTTYYDITGANTLSDAIVTLDDQGRVAKLTLESEDLEGDMSSDAQTYVRSNTFSIDYTYDVDETLFTHKVAYEENRNPELKAVFDRFAEAQENELSYRFDKAIVGTSSLDSNNDSCTGVTGFFTRDNVYFRQWGPDQTEYNDDGKFYNNGDDYDYGAIRQADGTYLAENCLTTYNADDPSEPLTYWDTITISTSALYTLDNYQSIGPSFNLINTDVFNKGEDGWYTLDDDLESSAGTYFDFAFLGVHSSGLEDSTKDFKLKVEEDPENPGEYILTAKGSFTIMDMTYDVTSTFSTASIGNTDLPEFCYTQEGTPFQRAA